MIRVVIPGEPHAQMRARSRLVKPKGGKSFVTTYDAPESRSWKGAAQVHMVAAMSGRPPLDGDLELTIRAWWECPRSKHRKRDPRPEAWFQGRKDADNVAKAVQDAGNGVLWLDDRQVVRLVVEKIRAAQGEPPRVELEVAPIAPRILGTGPA